ncbi:hypothetical protein HP439_13445 [Sphingobacterium shayense]|uniref:toxin-antitoxin system YwqK family antitoxin n=1 Tax=Sphingobacterium shayense TaxID=626343 RepID=UPI001556A7CC|nr:hypothetical protein [Sphingobacterium shayense]NQD71729.1 hypothetical protein [Sphingobacterium shayense]
MKKNLITLATMWGCIISLSAQELVHPELELLRNIQNRITINHDSGMKEVFTVTEKSTKTKSQKIYSWYQSQKVQHTQGGYSGKLLDGKYTSYYSNKHLAKQGSYKNGLANGTWKFWREDNMLQKEEQWKQGRQNGTTSHYNERGQLLQQGVTKDGKWEGKIWTYQPADSSYAWTYFHDGKSISQNEFIDSSLFRRTGRFFKGLWNRIFRQDGNSEQLDPEAS